MKKYLLLLFLGILILIPAFFLTSSVAIADTTPTFSALGVSNITQTTATVSWTTNINTDSKIIYHVFGALVPQLVKYRNESTITHSLTLDSLTAGTEYEATAYTDYQNFPHHSSSVRFTTLPLLRVFATPTPAPVIIHTIIPPLAIVDFPIVRDLTTSGVTIRWITNNPSDSHVEYYTDAAHPQSAGQNESVTTHDVVLRGLSSNTTYFYKARSKDSANHEVTSQVYRVWIPNTTDTTPPIITSVQTTNISQAQATIKWKANEISNSWVFYSISATDATFVMDYEFNNGTNDFVPVGSHQRTLSDLVPGTTYSYRVLSKDSSQNFGVSNRGTFTTLSNQNTQAPQEIHLGDETLTTPTSIPPLKTKPLDNNQPANGNSPGSSSSTSTDFENNKKAVVEELKKEPQNNSFDKTQGLPFLPSLIFGIATSQDTTAQLLIAIIIAGVIGGGIILLKIYKHKHSKQKPSQEGTLNANASVHKEKKVLVSTKTVIIGTFLIIILMTVLAVLPFATGFLYTIPYYFQKNDNDKELEKALNEYLRKSTFVPTTPSGTKNNTANCTNLWFVPPQLKNVVYACQDIYVVDENTLAKQIPASAGRVILTGKYSDYNCPVTSEKVGDILKQCYKRAKFLDDWQFIKTSQVLGIPLPTQKVHFTVVNSYEQAKEICMQAGLDSGAVVCINDSVIYIPEDMLKERGDVLKAYEFEKLGDKKITYEIQVVSPKNCAVSHMHELQHFFDFQAYGKTAAWFEESLVALVQDMMYSDICPPGFSYENVKKEVNGQKTSLPNFDLFSLNTEVPLTSRVEDYAQENQCRRGIDMQIAKLLHQQKTAYLPALFSALKVRNGNTESDIAKAVWESTQKETDVKNFLLSNSCSF